MAVCRVRSLSLFGIDAVPVEAEVDVSAGLPGFSIVGLPDAAVQEARECVRVAISNSGYKSPTKKVIVNLAPAGLRKEGGTFDLPMALGIMASAGILPPASLEGTWVVGEVSLDGDLRGPSPWPRRRASAGWPASSCPRPTPARRHPRRVWACTGYEVCGKRRRS